MVVDDEQDAVEFVTSMLEDIGGIETASANDGDSAIAAIGEKIPDLVILDVQMPGKNGFEVFAELRQKESTKHTPIIMLTGIGEKTGMHFSSEEMGEFYGGKPPETYIEKPVSPDALKEAVKKVLGL
jgi:CheY-like chemotaxis protein